MILAGIDIGTNTLRLLIAEIDAGSFREIHSDRRITRLGQHIDRTGELAPEAEDRTLETLCNYAAAIRRLAADHTAAVGTSALRKASNALTFIRKAEMMTGLSITVISGEEEARLTLRGVAHSVMLHGGDRGSRSRDALVVDIGGGSTEIIRSRSTGETIAASFGLGAVYLTERFLAGDPPSQEELGRLRSAVRAELAGLPERMRNPQGSLFIGTAGTVTTLAAVDLGLDQHDPERINGHILHRDFIDDLVPKLGSMTVQERRTIRGLDAGREDIVLAGAIVVQEIMRYFGYTSMLVSDWGLREGIVLDLHDRFAALPQNIGAIKE